MTEFDWRRTVCGKGTERNDLRDAVRELVMRRRQGMEREEMAWQTVEVDGWSYGRTLLTGRRRKWRRGGGSY